MALGWYLKNRRARNEQSLLFDIFKSFNYIESSNIKFFFSLRRPIFCSPRRPIFFHEFAIYSELPCK